MPPKRKGKGRGKNPKPQTSRETEHRTVGESLGATCSFQKDISENVIEHSGMVKKRPEGHKAAEVTTELVEVLNKCDIKSGSGRGRGYVKQRPINETQNQFQSEKSGSFVNPRTVPSDVPKEKTIKSKESVSEAGASSSTELMPVGEACSSRQTSKILIARKPGYGTSKKKEIRVITNFFRISSKNNDIYHYDVEITLSGLRMSQRVGNGCDDPPKPIGTEICRQVIFEVIRINNDLKKYTPVFHGKNLFTSKPLPNGGRLDYDLPVVINGRQKRYSVTIKPVEKKKSKSNVISQRQFQDYAHGKIDFPEELRMVYEAILSHREQDFGQIKCGISFFFIDRLKRSLPLSDGLEVLFGYSQNIRFTETGVTAVFNMVAAAFHPDGPIIKYISKILKKDIHEISSLNNRELGKLNAILKGVRISVIHSKVKRKYYIQEVTNCKPRDHRFVVEGKEMSVEEYFRQVYDFRIRYCNLPLLLMRGGKVRLPFEVCCVVPGQRIPGRKLDGKATADMIKKTAIPPINRLEQIERFAETATNISMSTMQHFGLGINLEPISVTARVLHQPQIRYSSNSVYPDEKGTWNMGRQNFSTSAKICKWVIISFAEPEVCNMNLLNKLAQSLCRVSRSVGLQLAMPEIRIRYDVSTESALMPLKDEKVKFVVVVLLSSSLRSDDRYEKVKFCADVQLGLVSQCVDGSILSNERKFNDKYISNLCLKINSKLGGVNHILCDWPLALESEAAIIFGADVVHSCNLAVSSIGAVVGCIAYDMSKYAVSCRALSNPKENGKNQEIILDLSSMVKTILIQYYRSTNRKPQKILFYRDGISEGQFQQALQVEVPLIKNACQSLEEYYSPPLTYIVVQKRVQTRLFPNNPRDGVGRMGNVPPGTVVDREIVDPVNFDFYLVSTEGIQGTTKPIYYTILLDENRVKPDLIQKLTFYLCHVYARCNRSISIPAPVKYADLLAYRAMHYVDAIMGKRGVGKYSTSQDVVPPHIKEVLSSIEKISNRMFFI